MKTLLRQDEELLKQGAANLWRNTEAVGGRLYLTTERLIFESHMFNIQRGITELEIPAISSIHPCWTKVFGIPLVPNSLAVATTDGKEHQFVLLGRLKWAREIEGQRARIRR